MSDTVSALTIIDNHPISGSMILILLLIVQQFIKSKHGKNDATKMEQENNKLSRQASETVNQCSEKTGHIISAIAKHLEKNDLGQIYTRLDEAVSLLEKVGEHQDLCLSALDRMSSLCRSIADDLQKTDSRIVHERINNKISAVESLVEDIKRIVISKGD